jgi:hypothetical protein
MHLLAARTRDRLCLLGALLLKAVGGGAQPLSSP